MLKKHFCILPHVVKGESDLVDDEGRYFEDIYFSVKAEW